MPGDADKAALAGIPEDGRVVISTNGRYWRQDARGYTADINEAGVFEYAKAAAATMRLGPEKQLRILPAPALAPSRPAVEPGGEAEPARTVTLRSEAILGGLRLDPGVYRIQKIGETERRDAPAF